MARLWVGTTLMLAMLPFGALAQAVPPPGFRELELALTISRAGHECPAFARIDTTSSNDPGWEILRPEVALCRNGKRFLVVTSGRRDSQPVVRPLPPSGKE